MFFLSFLFFVPILLNIFRLAKFKSLKILSKISIGIGTGLSTVSTLYIPLLLIIKISILVEINFIVDVITYIRVKHIKEPCLECEYEEQ